ncbi:MAG: ribosome maturation factor RimP [Candidatus Latescibacteria bacterium]|nr:ribosome maturation factor RimP [Candidatus Latescibacterota bacterium]MCY4352756.1 ribosome maturation factor RimP [Gemmatimonadota bacterium]
MLIKDTLTHLILPLLNRRDVELVEMAVSGGHRRKIVRIFVDRPDGITVDECAALSRDIADILDTRDPIDSTYLLEVSSPGLTRPLKTDRDFERVVGKSLRLVVDGLGVAVGTLLQVKADHLDVELQGERTIIERAKIQKATMHFEL